MKPSGFKVKKPYYLTEYLKFILPFLKPTTGIESADDSQYDSPQHSNDSEIVVNFIKEEPADGEQEENAENNADNGILNDLLTRNKGTGVMRKRRRFVPARKNYTDSLRPRNKPVTSPFSRNFSADLNSTTNNNNSAMKMFLMSLLPEIETMNEDQIRLFKIKSMMLIDEIKVNYAEVRQSTASLNNERLQKRLINLLLKNLNKTTKESAKSK